MKEYPVRDKVEYIVAFVNEFARRFELSDEEAYRYLRAYNAISVVNEHYGILHTLDFPGNVEDVATYCRRKGGGL